jgi:hypothetical protein
MYKKRAYVTTFLYVFTVWDANHTFERRQKKLEAHSSKNHTIKPFRRKARLDTQPGF